MTTPAASIDGLLERPYVVGEALGNLPSLGATHIVIDRGDSNPVPGMQAWRHFLEGAVDYQKSIGATATIILNGHEPLMSPHIVELAQVACDIGVGNLGVRSSLRRSGTSARKFTALIGVLRPGSDELIVSLGADDTVPSHIPPHIISGIHEASSAGIPVTIETEVTDLNQAAVLRLTDALLNNLESFEGVRKWLYHGSIKPQDLGGIAFNAYSVNVENGIATAVRLNNNGSNTPLVLDSTGALYMPIFDQCGKPQTEAVFGSGTEDFMGSLRRFHLFCARRLYVEHLLNTMKKQHGWKTHQVVEARVQLLTMLAHQTYESQIHSRPLAGYDRKQLSSNEADKRATRAPKQIELNLARPINPDPDTLAHPKWPDLIKRLSSNGLEKLRLNNIGWPDSHKSDEVLNACREHGVQVSVVANKATEELTDEMSHPAIREIVVPIEFRYPKIEGRLAGHSYNVMTKETIEKIQTMSELVRKTPGSQLTILLEVQERDTEFLASLPGILRYVGLRPEEITIELVEPRPLTKSEGDTPTFASPKLRSVEKNLQDQGIREVRLREWSSIPSSRVCVDRTGLMSGYEILMDGTLGEVVYGTLLSDAAILSALEQYDNHRVRANSRRENIQGAKVPMGYRRGDPIPPDSLEQFYNNPVAK